MPQGRCGPQAVSLGHAFCHNRKARVDEVKTLTSTVDQARLLAVTSPHSGDWLHALPFSGCGLRLDDKAIHIGARSQYASATSAPCGTSVYAKASPVKVKLVDLLGIMP